MIKKYPYYIRTTMILLGLVLICYCLFVLKEIFVPLAFALLISILLNPVEMQLERWRVPRLVAIIAVVVIAVIIAICISYFLYTQIAGFSRELPLFQKKLTDLFQNLQNYASQHYHIDFKKQDQYISDAENAIKPVVTAAMGTAVGTISIILLLPVYTFLILYYKALILNFLYEVFAEENAGEVREILNQTRGAVQNYMAGLLLEALIVASLNTIALLVIGVDYAILLGILGALLNVLPFFGGILATILPVLVVTATRDGFHTQLTVIVAYIIIQFVDNHFLIPYIVSSRVKINALIAIIIILLGGFLWGIPGTFLSIPFIGVLKIIFDRIDVLKPWGKLLGKEVPVIKKAPFSRLRVPLRGKRR